MTQRVLALCLTFVFMFVPSAKAAHTAALSRPHLAPAVVYVTNDGHIHELVLKGAWQHRDLTAAAGAPIVHPWYPRAMAFRRSDGVSTVVYRGADDHVHALYLELRREGNDWREVWHWADMNAMTGSPAPASEPCVYTRSDGISTVLYVGADGHIHDLRLEGGWIWADLTAISGAPKAAPIRPVAYVRGDRINAIVYNAAPAQGGHMYELRLDGGWKWTDLTARSGAPIAKSDFSAYVRSDGISTIVYPGYLNNHIYELRLEGNWVWSDLTKITGAPGTGFRPFGYVRSDGINAIVYGTDAGRLYELRLENGWQSYELTSVANAALGYRPIGYVRADGISAVAYGGADDHIHELSLQGAWHWADLTALAGAPVPASHPWSYNRSVVARVYLPSIVR